MEFPYIDFEMQPLLDCLKQFFEMIEHITFYFDLVGFISYRDLFLSSLVITAIIDFAVGHFVNHDNEE